VHKIQAHNLFISAGMIVGFDNDDPAIFDEQYEFLQSAQIPIVMLSVLLAVPKTPLYKRLQAEGRLLTPDPTGSDRSHYVGTAGGTNFPPRNMTCEELKRGQERLYRRLYAPGAFAARLLGNLSRFRDVRYRPERMRASSLAVLGRLIGHYWRQGPAARRVFLGCPGKALGPPPRPGTPVGAYMGVCLDLCKVPRAG